MEQEVTRIAPLRAANIGALVYGLLMAAIAILFSPLILISTFLAPPGESSAAGGVAIVMLVLYPVMGLVMGWISGLLASAFYNFVTRWTGGLLVAFRDDTAAFD